MQRASSLPLGHWPHCCACCRRHSLSSQMSIDHQPLVGSLSPLDVLVPSSNMPRRSSCFQRTSFLWNANPLSASKGARGGDESAGWAAAGAGKAVKQPETQQGATKLMLDEHLQEQQLMQASWRIGANLG